MKESFIVAANVVPVVLVMIAGVWLINNGHPVLGFLEGLLSLYLLNLTIRAIK